MDGSFHATARRRSRSTGTRGERGRHIANLHASFSMYPGGESGACEGSTTTDALAVRFVAVRHALAVTRQAFTTIARGDWGEQADAAAVARRRDQAAPRGKAYPRRRVYRGTDRRGVVSADGPQP